MPIDTCIATLCNLHWSLLLHRMATLSSTPFHVQDYRLRLSHTPPPSPRGASPRPLVWAARAPAAALGRLHARTATCMVWPTSCMACGLRTANVALQVAHLTVRCQVVFGSRIISASHCGLLVQGTQKHWRNYAQASVERRWLRTQGPPGKHARLATAAGPSRHAALPPGYRFQGFRIGPNLGSPAASTERHAAHAPRCTGKRGAQAGSGPDPRAHRPA